MTSIEWTNKTWNPITGCTKISAGCRNCYAETIAKRFWGARSFSEVRLHENRLTEPLKWRKPAMVFVNSMSDLFHESVSDANLSEIFEIMLNTPEHIYQVLTKRPERMVQFVSTFASLDLPLPPNIWLGVTVENQKAANDRIPLLLEVPSQVRFLSCEPLLEDLDLRLWARQTLRALDLGGLPHAGILDPGIDWVIVGGESGNRARPCDVAWIRSIVAQCQDASIPVFVKQLGSNPVGISHRTKGKGNNLEEMPQDLQIRQFPRRQLVTVGGGEP